MFLDVFGFIVSELLIFFMGIACLVWALHLKRPPEWISLSVAVAISQLGKIFVASWYFRDRPGITYLFDSLPYNASFPSGHTAGAFALAFTVLMLSHWKSSFGWSLFGLSFLVAFGRVFEGLHYVSDTMGGFVLGWVSAWIAVKGAELLSQESKVQS